MLCVTVWSSSFSHSVLSCSPSSRQKHVLPRPVKLLVTGCSMDVNHWYGIVRDREQCLYPCALGHNHATVRLNHQVLQVWKAVSAIY